MGRWGLLPSPTSSASPLTMMRIQVKLVLKRNKHYVESGHAETIRILLRDEIVGKARVQNEGEIEAASGATYGLEKDKAPKRAGLVIPGTKEAGAPEVEMSETDKIAAAAKAADLDLFTAVIGVEQGQSRKSLSS